MIRWIGPKHPLPTGDLCMKYIFLRKLGCLSMMKRISLRICVWDSHLDAIDIKQITMVLTTQVLMEQLGGGMYPSNQMFPV